MQEGHTACCMHLALPAQPSPSYPSLICWRVACMMRAAHLKRELSIGAALLQYFGTLEHAGDDPVIELMT